MRVVALVTLLWLRFKCSAFASTTFSLLFVSLRFSSVAGLLGLGW